MAAARSSMAASSRPSMAGGGGGGPASRTTVAQASRPTMALSSGRTTLARMKELAEDDGIPLPTQEHLETLKSFVDGYAGELRDVEEALGGAMTEVWDTDMDPISLDMNQEEQCSLRELLRTDNKIVLKVLTVFSVLCEEVNTLRATAKDTFFAPLAMFGERVEDEKIEEGDDALNISRILPLLEDLCAYVKRCHAVVKNMVSQLASLFNESQPLYKQSFQGVHLLCVFKQLGELLGTLVALDCIIASNDELLRQWGGYKRMIKNTQLEPSMFGTDAEALATLEMSVNSIEVELLQGCIFRNCIAQDFQWIDERAVQEARLNRTFMEEFSLHIKQILSYLAGHIGDTTESDHQRQFIALTSLYVLHSQLSRGRDIDKKLHKQLTSMTRKIPLIHIYGRAVWVLDDFVSAMLPHMPRATDASFLPSFVRGLDDTFAAELQVLYLQVCTWMVRMESSFNTQRVSIADILSQRTNLLIQGVLLAYQVSALAKLSLFSHLHTNVPFKESTVRSLGQCVELTKAVQATYFRRMGTISDHIVHIRRYLALLLEQAMEPIKVDLEAQLGSGKKGSWRQDDMKLDTLSEITLMMSLLKGPSTETRRLLLNLTWDLMHKRAMREVDVDEVRLVLRKMEMISMMHVMLVDACDCSWLLCAKDLLGPLMTDVYAKPEEANRLHYLMAAMRDPVAMLEKSLHLQSNLPIIEQYKRAVEDALDQVLITPLCRDIETDLRLHIHSAAIAQLAEGPNPLKQGIRDLSCFLKMRPLRFFGQEIDIKARVTHYLDTTFYNLTTVTLHDWKTYGEMRNLVQEKYGVTLTETHLPTGTLEQGLDVLEIMRNIHVFVSRYDYNLNTQVFVERPTDNKYINSIGIQQIANSIRTHGTGIMNTTVNYTYQFLTRKFSIFSQFLFDDHIKSRLIKDIRFFRQNREALDNKYPFERADKFNKDIRKLGTVGAENATYLDKFRELVTEIGNALGFVRMIRAGGLNYCANAVKFVPDLKNMVNFEECTTREHLSPESIAAAKNLDEVLDDLTKKFAEGTDFFQLLSSVFSAELTSERNAHLKNFLVIIPPLCINFAEYMMRAKDRLTKNAKRGVSGTFTDDGFAIGVAYILKVLDQNKDFDSLHWFVSVKVQMAQEKEKLDRQRAEKKKMNDEEMSSMRLATMRLQTRMMEFDQLFYSLSGARIFFKD